MPKQPKDGTYSIVQKTLAWATHAFTASGMVAGFMAILEISQHNFPAAFYWLAASMVIDGVDGTFARLFKVKEVLPFVDGKQMDYVVDFANYAVIPAYFIYECGWYEGLEYHYILPDELRLPAVVIILIVSVLYYGISGMVTEDYYFLGFPVMWNVVAFYLYFVFQAAPWLNFSIIAVCAAAHFFPIKFVYPSRTKRFMKLTILFSLAITVTNVALIATTDHGQNFLWLRIASGICLAYFVGISLYATWFEKEVN